MNSDVLIIGGGIIGLSIARALKKRGARRITILERGAEIGQEASLAAAGMLAPQAEADKIDDFFRFCTESNKLYPRFAEELLEETGVDVELDRTGTLYLAFTESDVEEIRRRYEWQRGVGLSVELLTAETIRKNEPFVSPDVREGLLFPEDWQVENRKVLLALHKFAEQNEIEIRTQAEVVNLLVENGKVTGAETAEEKFFAETTVLATGAWTSLVKLGGAPLPMAKVSPVRGQIIAFQTVKRFFNHVLYSRRGYIVPRLDGRILLGATVENAGFDKSVTAEGVEYLLENGLEISPSLGNLEIIEKWAGLRPITEDGLPILGSFSVSEKLLVATAHYRNGILLAPLTAEILADKISENKESQYLQIFSPRRFHLTLPC